MLQSDFHSSAAEQEATDPNSEQYLHRGGHLDSYYVSGLKFINAMIYFDAQIVPDVVSGNLSQMALSSESINHVPTIL
jgi:hypothetical protein